MITIKKMISILILISLIDCKSIQQRQNITKEQYLQRDCIKVANQSDITTIKKIYNKEVERNYLDFNKSKNEIDIILVITSYGYNITQEVRRLYINDGEKKLLNKGKITEVSKRFVDELMTSYSEITTHNLHINCTEHSSKQLSYELLFKRRGKLVFSFSTNYNVLNIDPNIANKELFFVKKFILGNS